MWQKIAWGVALFLALVWCRNTSLVALPAEGTVPKLIAHRGVAQNFHREGLTNDTCTAERIFPPTHGYLENTLPSMQAAFAYGANVVELDIHPTPDGKLAVFHDWTLDCRTDGSGVTRETAMAVMATLDIGYGYTADGGETYPFRGQFVGMMPTLEQVFDAFPNQQFLVNFKGGTTEDAQALHDFLQANPDATDNIWGVYGGGRSVEYLQVTNPSLYGMSKATLMACLKPYLMTGWTGHVPKACHRQILFVPISHVRLMWGWPHTFAKRMNGVGSRIVIVGEYSKGDPGTTGIDSAKLLSRIPENFDGYIWTNTIEEIGPMMMAGPDW